MGFTPIGFFAAVIAFVSMGPIAHADDAIPKFPGLVVSDKDFKDVSKRILAAPDDDAQRAIVLEFGKTKLIPQAEAEAEKLAKQGKLLVLKFSIPNCKYCKIDSSNIASLLKQPGANQETVNKIQFEEVYFNSAENDRAQILLEWLAQAYGVDGYPDYRLVGKDARSGNVKVVLPVDLAPTRLASATESAKKIAQMFERELPKFQLAPTNQALAGTSSVADQAGKEAPAAPAPKKTSPQQQVGGGR